MFDTYIQKAGDSSTRVEVKQAGLHDAVKNYKEFRDDAEKAAASLEISKFGANNSVKYLRADVSKDFSNNNVRTHLVFSVNNEIYRVEKVLSEFDIHKSGRDPRLFVAEAIADAIVAELLKDRKL